MYQVYYSTCTEILITHSISFSGQSIKMDRYMYLLNKYSARGQSIKCLNHSPDFFLSLLYSEALGRHSKMGRNIKCISRSNKKSIQMIPKKTKRDKRCRMSWLVVPKGNNGSAKATTQWWRWVMMTCARNKQEKFNKFIFLPNKATQKSRSTHEQPILLVGFQWKGYDMCFVQGLDIWLQ